MAAKKEQYRVWWIPQIPANGEVFYADVETPEEGWKLVDILAKYDEFQYQNNIKGDFCNAGGVEVFEHGDWSDLDEPQEEDE